jgi:hypothetical protein
VGVTAHVLVAFLSVPNAVTKYTVVIKKATDYIVGKIETISNLHSLALAAYVLQKTKHSSVVGILRRLEKAAIEKLGYKWWAHNIYYWDAATVSLEITSIILSTYADAGLHSEGFSILQWLIIENRSPGISYQSTETVLMIEALAKMASKLYVSDMDTDMDVKVRYGNDGEYNVKLNRENTFVLESYILPKGLKKIEFQFKGKGLAVVQVAYKYYVLVPEPTPRFNLDITVRDSLVDANLNLAICISFIVDDKASQSGPTTVEVSFPSGYTFNGNTLAKLRSFKNVYVTIPNSW